MASAVVVSGDASAGSAAAAAAAATGDTAAATESAVVAGGAATFKAPTTSLSRNWKVDKKHVASFTGGTAAFTPDGATLLAQCGTDVSLLDVASGATMGTLQQAIPSEARDVVVTFAIHPKGGSVVAAGQNLLLRHWGLEPRVCLRSWKAHRMPVLCMAFERTGTLLATGGSDRAVMVWDVEKGYCTHNFRGHGTRVTHIAFHPRSHGRDVRLVSCSQEGSVRLWNLGDTSAHATLKNHMSVVTGTCFSASGRFMITCGRDKVLSFWDLTTGKCILTLPAFEALLGIQTVEPALVVGLVRDKLESTNGVEFFATAGEHGLLRLWGWRKVSSGGKDGASPKLKAKCLLDASVLADAAVVRGATKKDEHGVETRPTWAQFGGLLWRPAADSASQQQQSGSPSGQLVAHTLDHSFVFVEPATMKADKLIVGHNDEIIDVAYVPVNTKGSAEVAAAAAPNRVVVASNSEHVRMFDLDTFGCSAFIGHTATVLAVRVSPDGRLVATASKDNTIRVWRVDTQQCIAVCEGHTEAVGAVCWPTRAHAFQALTVPWLLSGSRDKTLKMWNMKRPLKALRKVASGTTKGDTSELFVVGTVAAVKAHDKDINCIACAPNDALAATASQDKTVKLWNTSTLQLAGVLRGHRRGVWAAEFSPVDQVIASASADRTVRLWSVTTMACLKTFEGHTASVLRVAFVRAGMQMMTSGADGLVKLWNIRDNECVGTFDGHDEKVWALAVRRGRDGGLDTQLVTGSADSVLCVWRDVTAEEAEASIEASEARLLKQQELFNAMASRNYRRAIALCLELEQPFRLRGILEQLLSEGPLPIGRDHYVEDMEKELAALAADAELGDGSGGPATAVVVAGSAAEPYGSAEGRDMFARVLGRAPMSQLGKLVEYVRDWNTTARNSLLAHEVLRTMFKVLPMPKWRAIPGIGDLVDGMLPYSSRHYDRLDRFVQSTYLLDYTLHGVQLQPQANSEQSFEFQYPARPWVAKHIAKGNGAITEAEAGLGAGGGAGGGAGAGANGNAAAAAGSGSDSDSDSGSSISTASSAGTGVGAGASDVGGLSSSQQTAAPTQGSDDSDAKSVASQASSSSSSSAEGDNATAAATATAQRSARTPRQATKKRSTASARRKRPAPSKTPKQQPVKAKTQTTTAARRSKRVRRSR